MSPPVVMFYDRFTAVCKPLNYLVIMSPHLCHRMIIIIWIISLVTSLGFCTLTLSFPSCGKKASGSFPVWVACYGQVSMCRYHNSSNVCLWLGIVIVITLILTLILISYGIIGRAVVVMKSTVGQRKSINTCGSHLSVVTIFYGAICTCNWNQAAVPQRQGKVCHTLLHHNDPKPQSPHLHSEE